MRMTQRRATGMLHTHACPLASACSRAGRESFTREKYAMTDPMESSRLDTDEPQNVIIAFDYERPDLAPLHDLETALSTALSKARVGTQDGHTVAADLSDGTLFLLGPDAEAIFQVVEPILTRTDFMQGARVTLFDGTPGDPGVSERQVTIAAGG
jgi:hypothetical protein